MQDLVDGLLAQHGRPTDVSDQVILKLITWMDTEAQNRMVLMHSSAGICDLRLKPISDEEQDD